MPDTNPDPFTAPKVQDNRTKPPGVLPKNAQTWVLCGLALLMVVVIALSGKNAPKERVSTLQQAGAVVDPNATRIREYQTRIEEETRKLREEQAQLARTQQVLGLPTAPAAPGPASPYSTQAVYPRAGETRYAMAEQASEGSVEIEKRKREYHSLFASNIALSYRKESVASASPEAATQTSVAMQTKPSALYGYLDTTPTELPVALRQPGLRQANETGAPSANQQAGQRLDSPARDSVNAEEGGPRKTTQETDPDLRRAEGKQYRLFEGTVLETVLTNRLDGYFSGPVNCMVTTNLYSHDGQHLLVPQGTRLLGEARKVEGFGQQRLAVFFHRLIMPDGYSVSLDKFQGLNQIGETGLVDQVNHHYLQIFGVSLAIGAIAGLGQVNTRSGIDVSVADAYQQGVAGSLSQSSLRILDRYLNVLPTITIREGHRVKVYLSGDLLLAAYEKHQMPSDL
jgi:type IV secretory pathway VirB10-like protein